MRPASGRWESAHLSRRRRLPRRLNPPCLDLAGTLGRAAGPASVLGAPHNNLQFVRAYQKLVLADLVALSALRSFLNRLLNRRSVRLFFGEHQHEPRNDPDYRRDCVFARWRRLVLAARARITRPVLKRRPPRSRNPVLAYEDGRHPGARSSVLKRATPIGPTSQPLNFAGFDRRTRRTSCYKREMSKDGGCRVLWRQTLLQVIRS